MVTLWYQVGVPAMSHFSNGVIVCIYMHALPIRSVYKKIFFYFRSQIEVTFVYYIIALCIPPNHTHFGRALPCKVVLPSI